MIPTLIGIAQTRTVFGRLNGRVSRSRESPIEIQALQAGRQTIVG